MMILRLIICSFFCLLWSCNDPRSEREKFRDHILCQLAKQMQKKGLCAIGSGGGCTREGKINLISIAFQYNSVMNMPKARELIVESIQTLLNLMNTDPENAKYFEHFPAPVDVIMMYILGAESPNDFNSVEAVDIVKGKISYDVKNPLPSLGQRYLTIKEESFEEAQRIMELGSETRSDQPR